jgi:hypothetical protein
MAGGWPVAITPLAGAAAATMTWRHGARLHVTVVVKATFAFIPGHAMTPVAPAPIVVGEEDAGPGLGLRDAGDLVPYLARTDVWLRGHAIPTHGSAGGPLDVRLAVVRDGEALLDKAIALDARSAGGRPGPAPIPVPALGPLSRSWPVRSRLLGAADPRRLEGPVISVPDSFDWTYFQAAPLDQRIGLLRGDEWLVLEGVHPTLPRIETQLPGARAAARLHGLTAGGFRPLGLVLDTVRVDVDRRRCTLSWRGYFPISGEQVLGALHVVAGVELPGRPLVWLEPEEPIEINADDLAGTLQLEGPSERLAVSDAHPMPPAADPLGGTLDLDAPIAAQRAERPATPFTARIDATASFAPPTAHRAPTSVPLGGTLGIDELTAQELIARPPTPFRDGPSTLPGPAAIPPMEDDLLGGTLGIDELTAQELIARPPTPFRDGPSTLPGPAATVQAQSDSLSGTLGIDRAPAPPTVATPPPLTAFDPLAGTLGPDEASTDLISQPVMPFRPGAATLPPARGFVPPARTVDDPLGGTLGISEETLAELIARPATPFVLPAWTAQRDVDAMPAGLGAQFLFAMAALEGNRPPVQLAPTKTEELAAWAKGKG